MWVEKTSTGYRLCDRVKIDGKIKRVTVPLEKDTAQARRKANTALSDKIQELLRPRSKRALFEVLDDYLGAKDIKDTTRIVTECNLKKAASLIGDVQLSQLNAPLIKRSLLESGKSPKTLNLYLKYLRTFIKWLYEYGYIDDEFSHRLSSFKDTSPKKDSSELYLEPDELKDVLSQMDGMPMYICKFLALTGCRVGEALALTMDDVGDYIIINKTFTAGIVSTPKTQSSGREIYVQPELKDLITEYRQWRNLYMMAYGVRTNYFLFSNEGTHYNRKNLDRALASAICSKHLHPHIFRHTHTALMADQGVSLEAISRRLGHSKSDITRDIYYHVTMQQKRKDEEAFCKTKIL